MNAHNTLIERTSEKIQSDNVLKNNGRTFYWARFFLGQESAESATKLYSFCRYLDDLADGNQSGKVTRLRSIQKQLLGEIKVQNNYIKSYLSLYDEQNSARLYALQLLDGLLSDQANVDFKSNRQLIRYSYRVAGAVGLMMSPFLGVKTPKALPFAIDLGIAMQLTNICRDVLEDAELGRCYIPTSNSPGQLLHLAEQSNTTDAQSINTQINNTLDMADEYYESGLSGLYYLSPQSQRAIAVTAYVYRQIGVKLRRYGTHWWEGRTVVSSLEKIIPTAEALLNLNRWTKQEPRHNHKLHTYLSGLPGTNSCSSD